MGQLDGFDDDEPSIDEDENSEGALSVAGDEGDRKFSQVGVWQGCTSRLEPETLLTS